VTPGEQTDFIASLVVSAAFLALTILTMSRGRRDPVVWRLVLLCIDLFAYGIFELIGVAMHAGGHDTNRLPDWFNNAAASMAPALFYHFVMAFVGRRREMRRLIAASYAYFGAQAVLCASPIFFARMDPFSGGTVWACWMLAGLFVAMVHGAVILARHARRASTEERARTRLVMAAMIIGGVANMTDLVDIAGASWSPHLGTAGLVASAAALTVAALRVRTFERLSVLTAALAGAIAIVVVLLEIAILGFAGDRSALAVIFTVLSALGAILAMRFVVADYAAVRERTLAHASLGRMAAQMARDIKHPIAAMRGVVQFLAEERVGGRSVDERHDLLDVVVAQCDRVTRIVSQYQRIGRSEALMATTDLNDAAREAMKFLGSAAIVDVHLTAEMPACDGDHELLVIALENVLRNAHEAAPNRRMHVETGVVAREHERRVFVSVRDEGPGMDSRKRERALEGFFTTKPHGSGLGLAFVRRVVEAHGGWLVIDSHEGEGTTVRIELHAQRA
jgi:two-component system sensor histidine kinase HydH